MIGSTIAHTDFPIVVHADVVIAVRWSGSSEDVVSSQGLVVIHTARQGSCEFVQKLHKRFMQGRRADLLIVDDVTDERPR